MGTACVWGAETTLTLTVGVLSLLRWWSEELSRTSGCVMNYTSGIPAPLWGLLVSPKMAAMGGSPGVKWVSLWLLVQPYLWPWGRLQGCVASTLGCTGKGFPAGRRLSGCTSQSLSISEDQPGRASWFMTVDVNPTPQPGT